MCISPTVLPALQLGHVQSKSSAQRLEDGKKLPTVTMQSRREGKAGASKRVGISKKVVSGVNRGRTNNQSKTLFQWLKKGNSLKDSSTYGTRTSEVGEGRGSRDCMMGGSGRGGGIDSGHDGSDICSNYHGGCSGVGAGGETGSGKDGSGDCVMDTSDSGAGGSASGIAHTRGTGNSGYSGGVSGASVAPTAAVDHFNPRTDLAPIITVVAASTAFNVSSIAFAACCSGVGAGGETCSGEDGSGDCVMDTSDSGAGGSASGIAHTRGTGNSGYSSGVSGASVSPAAAVDHFNPRTDLAPVISVVAASTTCNVSSIAFAASARENNNGSGWGSFEEPLDMLLKEELEMWKQKENDSMDEGAQEDGQFEMEIDNEDTVGSESISASENSEEDDDCWK